MAATGIGLAAVVVAVVVVAFLAVAALAAAAGEVVVVEVAPADCVAVPLVANIEVEPGVIAVAEFVPTPVAGAQGAALAVFCVTGAAGAAAFFLNSDPRLENAAVAFDTAVFAPAGT